MISASFSAIRYIDSPRYLPRDADSMETRRLKLKEMKIDFRVAAAKSTRGYRKQQTWQVVMLKYFRVD